MMNSVTSVTRRGAGVCHRPLKTTESSVAFISEMEHGWVGGWGGGATVINN